MKLLVTGGCGFIGSNFIKYLLENHEDIEIFNLDLGELHYAGKGKNLEHMGLSKHPFYHFIQGDITDREAVEKALKENFIDAVVNFAAESHVDRSIENDAPFAKANFEGTRVLLNASVKHGIKKFVQIGTDEVYGSSSDSDDNSKETDLLKPSSSYSASKAAADLLALAFFKTHNLPVCVTRSSNNYGPFQFPEKVIPLFITNLLEGKKVPLYGEGKNIRDWLHVKDNCDAIFQVLIKGKPGEIYNVGGGNEVKNIELTKNILNQFGFGDEKIQFVEDRKGHDLKYSLNCEKIKNELAWEPKINFTDGIRKTIQWYKENRSWWEKLKINKKEILVLGKGFLGKAFEKRGFEVWGKDKFEITSTNFHFVLDKLKAYDVIINCIGKSNTRWCENPENWNETLFANGEIPKILSEFCEKENKKLVHISTGCLYDRNDFPQKEDDPLAIATHCNYTVTKRVGENFCNPKRDLIIRPRLFFGDSEDKNNLLCKLPRFERFLTEINSYASVHVIIDAVVALLNAKQSGIFNVACEGYASVKELSEWIGLNGGEISEEELHKSEKLYLVNNIMDISKLQKFYQPPKLKDEIIRCWSELKK